ncbi:hypothetical protein Efla_002843 [Eimeria flavescens]
MAYAALKADVVLRLRACSAADEALYAACARTLMLEKYHWLKFVERCHVAITSELAEKQLLQRPAEAGGLTVLEKMSRISHLRGLAARAEQALEIVRRQHLELFQQYALLEASINEMSLEPPTSFSRDSRVNGPATTAAAPDGVAAEAAGAAAAYKAFNRLTQLQSVVYDKEKQYEDQQQQQDEEQQQQQQEEERQPYEEQQTPSQTEGQQQQLQQQKESNSSRNNEQSEEQLPQHQPAEQWQQLLYRRQHEYLLH